MGWTDGEQMTFWALSRQPVFGIDPFKIVFNRDIVSNSTNKLFVPSRQER